MPPFAPDPRKLPVQLSGPGPSVFTKHNIYTLSSPNAATLTSPRLLAYLGRFEFENKGDRGRGGDGGSMSGNALLVSVDGGAGGGRFKSNNAQRLRQAEDALWERSTIAMVEQTDERESPVKDTKNYGLPPPPTTPSSL